MAEGYLLDASAVLALLQDEPGADAVEAVLGQARISAVNLAEVLGVLQRRNVPAAQAEEWLDSLGLTVVAADLPAARQAARFFGQTRPLGLSLGDCFCLGTGAELGCTILTADASWRAVQDAPPLSLIR